MSRDRPDPRIIAHQGFAGVNPENTVRAARAAAEAGADMVEVDAVPCADGEVVVFHDERLDRADGSRGVTDSEGVVWETPCETVLDAEVLDSGETVPRLADLAAAVPDEVGLNVELKHPGVPDVAVLPTGTAADRDARRRRWEPFVEDVVAAIDGADNEVLLSSFYPGALAAAREVAPDHPLGVLFVDDADDALDRARRLDAEAVHPPVEALIWTPDSGAPTADDDLVARAREEGRAVNAWTARTWYEAVRLRDAGVDGIFADYPGLLSGP